MDISKLNKTLRLRLLHSFIACQTIFSFINTGKSLYSGESPDRRRRDYIYISQSCECYEMQGRKVPNCNVHTDVFYLNYLHHI